MTRFGPDPLDGEIARILEALGDGRRGDLRETAQIDFKEEAGRRSAAGIGPSDPRSEPAAKHLAGEAACMANTPGGGALIVGVADDGELIGTDLDAEWLRYRIYELTDRALTVDARPHEVAGHRVLVLRCVGAVEPVRYRGKITWRVDDHCVEIDASTWHGGRLASTGFDWSLQPSGHAPADARPGALAIAREYLRASGEERALELAALSDAELLVRLDAVTGSGELTNASAVAFVGRPSPAVDYIRRDYASGDSTNRVRLGGRGLLEELDELEKTIRASNPLQHQPVGLVTGQYRLLPDPAIRETLVNAGVHRDWTTDAPIVVEHEGNNLVVRSPGGFVGGVTPDNIITHPSQPRNRALAELFESLRVAEREGVGVDRMIREMISVGHPRPLIEEVPGPAVRAVLVGEVTDNGWIRFLAAIEPAERRRDLNSLMLLRRLVDDWWIDVERAAPLLQRSADEARAALAALERATVDGRPLAALVDRVPAGSPQAWKLSSTARNALEAADTAARYDRTGVARSAIALDWARARGRISTSELGSVVDASATNLGGVLRGLEAAGQLLPGRETRRGAGFFYVPT